jgi:hypothetical protein
MKPELIDGKSDAGQKRINQIAWEDNSGKPYPMITKTAMIQTANPFHEFIVCELGSDRGFLVDDQRGGYAYFSDKWFDIVRWTKNQTDLIKAQLEKCS